MAKWEPLIGQRARLPTPLLYKRLSSSESTREDERLEVSPVEETHAGGFRGNVLMVDHFHMTMTQLKMFSCQPFPQFSLKSELDFHTSLSYHSV